MAADPFLSYGRLPTWTGIAADWHTSAPALHLYDTTKYPGHADFVSRGLGTGITFRQFVAQARDPAVRRYLPFFLYRLESGWALRLEDYGYRDPPEKLAAQVLRLARLIARERGPNGIVLLATSAKVLPNRLAAPTLERAGFETMTVQQLLDRVGARAVQVLNEGTAVGTLRLIADPMSARPDDIAIFDTIPRRVPPVAGIVTLAPQTPLSHVNLLARNRGTVNLYARSLDAIPGASALVGRLIRLDADGTRIRLAPITRAAADRWRAKNRRPEVSLPPVDRSFVGPIGFVSSRPGVSQVGAKAANYARLQAALPKRVRPGAALGFAPYLAVVRTSGAATQIADLVAQLESLSRTEVRDRLKAIRKTIREARFPPTVLARVRALVDGSFAPRVRLRSSTNCEDLPAFNGAGLYRSKGFDTSDSDATLERALLKVYASLWRHAAFLERQYFGIRHQDAAMAILFNRAFTQESLNGVAITTVGERPELRINLVDGSHSITNPTPGVESRIVTLRFGDRPSDPLIARIATDLEAIHRRFASPGFGVDVELKVMADGVFYKQVRPLAAPKPN